MKKFIKIFSFCFIILLSCVSFCACSQSGDNKDPKSKDYPNIPDKNLIEQVCK